MDLTAACMHAGEGAQITHLHSHAALQYQTALHLEHLFSAPTLPHEAQACSLCAVHAPTQGGIVSREGKEGACMGKHGLSPFEWPGSSLAELRRARWGPRRSDRGVHYAMAN